MGQVVRYQEILRKLAIIDDGFVEDPAGLGLGLGGARVLDPRTAALVQVAALAAIGSPAVCLEWSSSRALAGGATEDEITDVLLAIAPVAGLGRVVTAVRLRHPGRVYRLLVVRDAVLARWESHMAEAIPVRRRHRAVLAGHGGCLLGHFFRHGHLVLRQVRPDRRRV
jgi:alkylhydroperoxidase/carboxymuconolactone decarboxylase family protein YurZ